MRPWDENEHDRHLLVEGESDLRFFAELFESMGIGDQEGDGARKVHIKTCNGKAGMDDVLRAWIDPQKLREKKSIAVVADGDEEPAARLERLVHLLRKATGAEVPTAGGWARSPSGCWIGCFVLPGEQRDDPGEIETLVWRSWARDPVNAHAKACIESFVDCMRAVGAVPKKLDKVRIGALLAVRNPDDPRLGAGAQARVFDLGSNVLTRLRDFLKGFSAR
ncbi:MAG: hypothetical protein IT457_00095 [Planctomycetes bacterium]|nr:hypothetical protein [Planctomycetota bacterium]